MTQIVCPKCKATVELIEKLTACPHCQQDIRRQIAQAKLLLKDSQAQPTEFENEPAEDDPEHRADKNKDGAAPSEVSPSQDSSSNPSQDSDEFDDLPDPLGDFETIQDVGNEDEDKDEDEDFNFEVETTEITLNEDSMTLSDRPVDEPVDPMMTLPNHDTDDRKTLGSADLTLQTGTQREIDDDFSIKNDTIGVTPEAISKADTVVVPPTGQANTIINPQAALEAAEQYSQGMNTIIPPRTISGESNPGQIQDYAVKQRLGAGAFGVVFRAMQVPLERSVAVKVLQDPEGVSEARRLKLKNEFLREAQFTGRLEHPNIVPIHDIGLTITPNGSVNPFYAMKEIRGESWLKSIRTASRRENLAIFKNVANAIGFAHDSNILHCDLKPDNVMVGEFGEVLVVDWGQAVDLSDESTMRPGGTPAYIAPEMAQYWCDIQLDKKQHSPAKQLVGFRTDVYLLGALLFEIVTGSPPHCREKNESPYEVMRLAAKNKIVGHEAHDSDELMQIALTAMRLGEKEPIETVEALLAALEIYENRLSSIELRQRANDILDAAKANSNYDGFQRARFGFEESLEKWSGNALSEEGLLDARLSSARLALKDQNFDLGIGILKGSKTNEENEIKAELKSGKSKRDRRKKLVQYLAVGLASSIAIGILINGFMIQQNITLIGKADVAVTKQEKAEEATREAKIEKENIEIEKNKIAKEVQPLKDEVTKNRAEIKQFAVKLEQAETEYDQQLTAKQAELGEQLVAEKVKFDNQLSQKKLQYDVELEAEQKRNSARLADEKKRFKNETKQLVEQKRLLNQQVTQLNESSKFLRYKSDVTNAVQKLQSGDYRETRELIDRFVDKTPWEIARLDLLAHREIEAIFPAKPLLAFANSADGSRFALVSDEQVEVHATRQFDQAIAKIPVRGVTAIALSSDGKQIAIATPADSKLKPGKIQIYSLANLAAPLLTQQLDAQSLTISQLEFSRDDSSFLSVGIPSKIRKSSGNVTEKELMIWKNWSPIDVKLIVTNGQLPKFSRATFSENGERILTTHPDALPMEQVVHVFEQRDTGFLWIDTSPTGLNAADFENPSGSSIVASARDSQSGTYSLVSWRLRVPTSSTQFIQTSTAKRDSVRSVAQLNKMARRVRRYGDLLVTAGQDRKVTLWNWKTQTPTSFGGHAYDIDDCMLKRGQSFEDHVIISVSLGADAEILKTDLATFEKEVEEVEIGKSTTSDVAAATTISRSPLTGQVAIGTDLGQVSVERSGKRVQWQVTAWNQHVLTDRYLFAQTKDDHLYQFNRQSGELERVLTQLSQQLSEKITRLDISDDGKTALVVTDGNQPEFHLWNLELDRMIRTVDYGAEDIFGTGTQKELLAFKLSPDGQWVIGGKVGVFAWSTRTGERMQLTKANPDLARSPISSIKFVNPGTRFLVSWKDRIDIFDLNAPEKSQRFNTQNIAYDKNEPNLFDARVMGENRILILARAVSNANQDTGIVLTDLKNGKIIANFESAKYAKFGETDAVTVLIVNNRAQIKSNDSAIDRWSMESKRRQSVLTESKLKSIFDGRFRKVETIEENKGKLTLQTTTKNKSRSTQRDWNTLSINSDLTVGEIRVFAQPRIQYHATAGDRSITLEQGTIRLWKLLEATAQPAGIIPGLFQTCRLSPDEKTLITVPLDSNLVHTVNPISGTKLSTFQAKSKSPIVSISWSSSSKEVALGLKNGIVELHQLEDGQWSLSSSVEIADSPISEIFYAAQSRTLLATVPDAGTAHVLNRKNNAWSHFILKHVDGRRIVTGDITEDGKRVVTGSDNGQLTIWNSESSASTEIPATLNRTQERELFGLQNRHQSPISFVRFFRATTAKSDIVSSESKPDKSKILIWKTATPSD